MSEGCELFQDTLDILRNSSVGAGMTEEELYDDAYRRVSAHFEQLNKDLVKDYLAVLIAGVVFLFVFWEVIVVFAGDIPHFFNSGTAVAAAVMWIIICSMTCSPLTVDGTDVKTIRRCLEMRQTEETED